MPKTITVGVFDSGKGGKSVAEAVRHNFPNLEVIFRADTQNLPYGSKSPRDLLKLVVPIMIDLSKRCDVIVVACNTITTTIINDLRQLIDTPIIGIEPMVKPASQITKSNVIAVCATPTTLKSGRYQQLKNAYAKNIIVLEPDCSKWAEMIEKNELDSIEIQRTIEDVLEQKADVIVLGCTHYHWIDKDIKKCASNRAKILQPEDAIMSRLKTVLQQLD